MEIYNEFPHISPNPQNGDMGISNLNERNDPFFVLKFD